MAQITAEFIGIKPHRAWMPGMPGSMETRLASPCSKSGDAINADGADSSDGSSTCAPTTTEEVRLGMAKYIRERLAADGPDDDYNDYGDYAPAQRADQKRCLLAALFLLADESTSLCGVTMADWNRRVGSNNDRLSPDVFYGMGVASIEQAFRKIDALWSVSRQKARADAVAQRTVCNRYGDRCVLTGRDQAQGAHIVPARALAEATMTTIWNWLQVLWPLERIPSWATKGHASRNVLPLGIEAHAMWDRHAYALRPMQDPSRPDQLYLQLEWIGHMNTETGVVSTQRDERRGTLVMYDRGDETSCPKIANGSVFCLTTTDHSIAPLPEFHLMQARNAISRLRGSIRAAGALSIIFSGNPPDRSEDGDDHVLSFEARMARIHPVWDDMIRTAMDCHVLTEAEAGCWADAFYHEFSRDTNLQQNMDR